MTFDHEAQCDGGTRIKTCHHNNHTDKDKTTVTTTMMAPPFTNRWDGPITAVLLYVSLSTFASNNVVYELAKLLERYILRSLAKKNITRILCVTERKGHYYVWGGQYFLAFNGASSHLCAWYHDNYVISSAWTNPQHPIRVQYRRKFF